MPNQTYNQNPAKLRQRPIVRCHCTTIAYLQSDKPLIRKIFITNLAPEFELSPEECLELPKPIYGLADIGDESHGILDDHAQIDLKMIPTIIDPSLYCYFEDDKLIQINESYVDDLH